MKARAMAVALSCTLLLPIAAPAQHGGGGRPGGGARPGGARPATAPRAAAAPRGAPAHGSNGGFNFDRDLAPATRQAPAARPPANTGHPPANMNRPTGNMGRPPAITASRPQRTVITNPRYHAQRPWDWNRGVAWAPAPHYWGGGFWGSFALDAAAAALGAAAFGAFTNPADNALITSYQVAPDSPGATLLANYGLTQTPCGPPDLVVILGPDNSVICATPNTTVGPGEYDLDPQTLTIVSE